jgi:YbgC/YbaW family acyl-CoA thioester hydrolase
MLNNIEVELEFSVKSYNIDAAGHVNNAVYINWLEDLRDLLIEKIIPREKLIIGNFHLIVANTNIDYKIALHLHDKPIGKIKLIKYEKGVLYLTSLIFLNDKVAAQASQKCVFIDKSSNKMITKNLVE